MLKKYTYKTKIILLEKRYSKSVSMQLTIKSAMKHNKSLSQILHVVPYFFFRTALLQENEQKRARIKSPISWQGIIIRRQVKIPLSPLTIIINEQLSESKYARYVIRKKPTGKRKTLNDETKIISVQIVVEKSRERNRSRVPRSPERY